jgi:putative acyl-CoA dehydrogenase
MTIVHDSPGEVVLNQAPPLENYNLATQDRALMEALGREGGDWAADRVVALGAHAGRPETLELGRLANESPPRLHTHDRYGNRIDEVEFHPAWHELMRMSIGAGIGSLPWREPQLGAHVARGALLIVGSQVEGGHQCPVTMTFAAVPALRMQPELAAELEPKLTSLEYDPDLRALKDKASALCGMAMTEKQGGSDVRANITRATSTGQDGEYAVTGHKWFCSAPMCDTFLMLAQTEAGVTCFLVPRMLPDGSRNAIHIQRLKDKLGNRSNASAEIELEGAFGRIVGEPGRGVPTIIEMVGHTRLDCALGSAAGMRAAVAHATHHAAHRAAFGKLLIDQPLMQNVLADLCIESEAATVGAMRLARAYDEADEGDEQAASFRRVATAVLKYWICKRAPAHAAEALEVMGGNGYVEESGMPRLFRESPLNSIWEGSGNVMCLDVLRALARDANAAEAFLAELGKATGADPRLDAAITELGDELSDFSEIEVRARRVVEHMALALQASLLVRHAPGAIADAFCASRLAGDRGLAFGTLPAGTEFRAIIDRHRPEV